MWVCKTPKSEFVDPQIGFVDSPSLGFLDLKIWGCGALGLRNPRFGFEDPKV